MDFVHVQTTDDIMEKNKWLEALMYTNGDPLTKIAYSYVKDVGKGPGNCAGCIYHMLCTI